MSILSLNRTCAYLFGFLVVLCCIYNSLAISGRLDLKLYATDFEVQRLFLALFFVLIFGFLNEALKKNPVISFFYAVFTVICVVPTLVIFCFKSIGFDYLFYFMYSAVVIFFALRFAMLTNLRLTYLDFGNQINCILLLTFLLGLLIISRTDISTVASFEISNLYSLREKASDVQIPGFHYLHHLLSKFAVPFCLWVAIIRRSYLLFSIFILLGLLLFVATWQRASLAFPLMAIAVYVCYPYMRDNFLRGLVIVLLMTMLLSYALLQSESLSLLGDILTRRLLFLPAELGNEYFQYFTRSGFTFFWNSKITLGLVDVGYEREAASLISDHVGMYGGHANTGVVGAAYQQLWILGIIVYSAILGVTACVVTAFAKAIGDGRFVVSILASYILWIFASSDLPPILLTHGLLVAMLVMYLCVPDIRRLLSSTEAR